MILAVVMVVVVVRDENIINESKIINLGRDTNERTNEILLGIANSVPVLGQFEVGECKNQYADDADGAGGV